MSRIARTLIISAMLSPVVLAAGVGIYLWPRYHQTIIISHGTTFITRPLHEDGTPNYIAAFNAIAGHGIKSHDNAAIPLLLILRPHESVLLPYWHSEIKALGVARLTHKRSETGSPTALSRKLAPDPNKRNIPPSAKGMVSGLRCMWHHQGKAGRILGEELQRAERRAWVASEAPALATYLDTNAVAFRYLRRAAALPRFFSALGAGDTAVRPDGLCVHAVALAAKVAVAESACEGQPGPREK